MRPFVFKLDPLLEVRRQAEKAAQLQVARIERQRQSLEESVRRRQQEISGTRQEMRQRLVGTLHADELRMHAAEALHHVRDAQRLVIELAGVHRRLEAARSALASALRIRRGLEELRARRYRAWLARRARAETAALDELAVMRRHLEGAAP